MWVMEIDRGNAVPLHKQIADLLRERIERGELGPGARIPPEEELCRILGVSRTPVRQALAQLVQEGLIERRRKVGTYVRSHPGIEEVSAILPEGRWEQPLRAGERLWRGLHPDRPLSLSVFLIGHHELREKVIRLVARAQAPDIALIDTVWLAEFGALDFLWPLGELDPGWKEMDFFPSVLLGNTIRGRLYGLQPEADLSGLWYRRDWLEAEGISPPGTWEELITCARHFAQTPLRERYRLKHSLLFPGGRPAEETTTYVFLSLVHSAGGEVFHDGHVELGEPAKAALRFLRDLVHRHRVAPGEVVDLAWDQAPRAFGRGEAVFSLGGSYEKALIQAAAGWDEGTFRTKAGFCPIPAGPGGRPASLAGGMTYVILRQARAPKLALQLLRLSTSPAVMRDFCVATGQNPTRPSAVALLDPEKDGFLQETARLLSLARFRPQIPFYAQASKELQRLVEDVLASRSRVEKAINRAEATLAALTP